MQYVADNYTNYFLIIEQELQHLYNIAKQARVQGRDPSFEPEPHVARDLAEMVEGLVGPLGVAKRIRELSGKMGLYSVAFKVAEDVIYARFGVLDEEAAAEQSVRTALAIVTGGITAAPLQGISQIKIKKNLDRTRYLAIYFAGPIRSAAGTEAALTLVIGDFVRRKLGLSRYIPTDNEILRFIEEIRIYEREVARFQYHISDEEIKNALRHLPVEVTGSGTDRTEVTSFRNLTRIETNRVRGGALRVLNDGVVGRSQKVLKIVEEVGIEGWEWLSKLRTTNQKNAGIEKKALYMEDVIAGRPILSSPSRSGGFRLRYGHARNTGLAALGIHPATMIILDNFLASGTQIRIEKPGKGGITLPVNTIEPPVVKLDNGSVLKVETVHDAEKLKNNVEEILFLGDLLIGFGEFLESNKPLSPCGYSEEWWFQELSVILCKDFSGDLVKAAKTLNISVLRLKDLLDNPLEIKPTVLEAISFSQTLNVPLHPYFTYFWKEITTKELSELRRELVLSEQTVEGGVIRKIQMQSNPKIKSILERICAPHEFYNNNIIITQDAPILALILNLENKNLVVNRQKDTIEAIKDISGIDIRDKGQTYIGARMGRPEKAKGRAMSPPVHVLFPTGLAGGSQRNILEAVKKGSIQVETSRRRCPKCNLITYKILCPKCGLQSLPEKICPECSRILKEDICVVCKTRVRGYDKRFINIRKIYQEACETIGLTFSKPIKGVKGLISADKIPEALEKGILRAKHRLSVFKDGTIRFDATDAPLTHFKSSEIGVSVERLRQLGYIYDMKLDPLRDSNQICELKVQDIIIPEKGTDYFLRTCRFIDELLQRMYRLQPYYNAKNKQALIGHLVIGFAPHTSAGVIGRIIGFTKANVCYAHPLWHNTKRRDCDGDEDSIMMVLDVLLNFSKAYLPARIGGMMDAPLIIISRINPSEVDEAHNIDVPSFYPLAFYEQALKNGDPKILSQIIDVISHRLGTPAQFQGYSFTHKTNSINQGNHESVYMKLGAMTNKLKGQLLLAEKIRAVDAKEVAEKVLTNHFMRDIVGNLRAFTRQKLRCKKCNAKYRRIPLTGKCGRCNGEVMLTVHKGGIEKYLDVADQLIRNYELKNYYQQRIDIVRDEIRLLFKTKFKQMNLGDFM